MVDEKNQLAKAEHFTKFHKFVFLAFIESNIIYLLILILLQIKGDKNPPSIIIEIPLDVIFLSLFFCLLSILTTLFIHLFWIPYLSKKEMFNDVSMGIMMIMSFGELISIFGTMFGILAWATTRIFYWLLILPFIIFGFINHIYLYKNVVKPAMDKYEYDNYGKYQ